jgi:hypothetical protein
VLLASAAGLLAAAAFSGTRLHRLALTGMACGLALRRSSPGVLELKLSPYKPLSQAMLLPDAREP